MQSHRMAKKNVTMKVFGMTCDDCVRHVTKGLTEGGAEKVLVSLKEGRASFVIDDDRVSPESFQKLPVFDKNSQYKAQITSVE